VTCLYSACAPGAPIGDPHSLQNLAVALTSVPHVRHAVAAVIRPSADPVPWCLQGALRIGDQIIHEQSIALTVIPTKSFEALMCRLLRETFQGNTSALFVTAGSIRARPSDC
jgi:hypothetical protein